MKLDKKSNRRQLAMPAGPALRRAARKAREIARRYGTPLYVMHRGKVVAEKP